jgi:hypothetical protein
MLALATLVEMAAILDHPCLAYWENLVAVAIVETCCQSSQVSYSHPCHPNPAFQFRMEYLAYPRVADEFGQLVDPVAKVGRVVSPSAVEVGAETLNVAFEGHH